MGHTYIAIQAVKCVFNGAGANSRRRIKRSGMHEFFFFYSFPIALKFGSRLGSNAVEDPVKFQSDVIVLTFSRVENLRDLKTVRFLT